MHDVRQPPVYPLASGDYAWSDHDLAALREQIKCDSMAKQMSRAAVALWHLTEPARDQLTRWNDLGRISQDPGRHRC
jgi:hypothetical protein